MSIPASATVLASAPRTEPRRLSRTAAFYLQASIILLFLAGSSAPTAIYALYQTAWGFSPITVTAVFAIYALAVLAALLVTGGLSDYVGRRPVLQVATLLQALAMLLFATAQGVGALLVARVVQGLSTGAAAGAVGAGMLDLDRDKGTVANAVGPMLGTATGALLSGLMVAFLPAPTVLVYVVLGVLFLAQAAGVAVLPETVTPRPGALASLRPRFHLPARARGPMLLAVPALVAAWALVGFYGSLGPTLVRRLLGSTSPVLGGLLLTTMAAAGALTVFLTRAWSPRAMTLLGTSMLMAGVVVSLGAVGHSAVGLLFVGTAVAGAGFGASFQGAIRGVVLLAAPHERAGLLSVLYVVAYLAFGAPAVLAGIGVVHGGGLLVTTREYGLAVIALAGAALLGTLLRRAEAVKTL
ncbi:MAG TPA: MFS transporter [Polyangia bacterium]|jgi:predicted MFS family arabinose efflux permease